ncbi:hypothetical protein SDC9_91398 [bioreactor metagenome]|uniref:Uncharacterized protein n=1 Tax=bioreactor metagenome TaxID=1076179 RepID=A0A644ZVC8_9ZZZZ
MCRRRSAANRSIAEIPAPGIHGPFSGGCLIQKINLLTVAAIDWQKPCLRQCPDMHGDRGVAKTTRIGGNHQLYIKIAGRAEAKLRILI